MGNRWRRQRGTAPAGAGCGRLCRCGVVAAVVALVLTACESPAEPGGAGGYDFRLPLDEGVVYRWPTGSTVRLYVHGTGDAVRDAWLEDAVDAAARDWEEALGPGVVTLARTESLDSADVLVRWSDVPPPVDVTACAPVVSGRAVTTFCPTPDYSTLQVFPLLDANAADPGRVRMIVTVLADEAVGSARVRQLVAHELGHVLGIGQHSPDPVDLMWDGPLGTDRPSASDRATLRALYRTRPTLVP